MPEYFHISSDKAKLDINTITDYLIKQSYWANDRTEDVIRKSIANSCCFGMYNEAGEQVGFARVVTDMSVFAWLMDVFILEDHRGRGLCKQLIGEIISYPEFKDIMKWGLGTRDAHELYKKFGFTSLSNPEVMMERKIE
ncbi:GNAT family N-acetyltransferase [Daejeonella sp.]|uniref:GNAT family N-acetyltransferase n=1 Tax=Daejeonella sp. TaxID=2805397 RepID=UPI0030C269C0